MMLQINPVYEPQMSQGSESLAAEWVTFRRCTDIDPNVFFPNDGAGVIVAQKVCAECPVADACREYALANNITHGVWGGTSERQRRRILRDRRRASKAARAA
ncbi:WhiB family transcriptional regulator [Candidatus Poriferisodalis sp.]|uniref:WhiB family transcriptional regulator n=1 Tax=Candidatus Poriferisodalis sp. TaxID=3101277 RepID=UPI003B010818